MKKLEDIPKNNPFSVPNGYFEKLPGVIQARVAEGAAKKQAIPYLRYALQYATPVVVLVIVAVLYLTPKSTETYNELLSSVSTEELTEYLTETDITTDEVLEAAEVDDESADAIEAEVFFNDIDLENLNDFDL